MIRRMLKIACLVSGPMGLLACAAFDPARSPAWELAGHPGLLYDVQLYYQRNALEENGRCTRPLFEGVTRSEVLAEDEEQLVIRLTYRYRDSMRDERRLGGMFRECTGFASRTFTIAKADGETRVVGMDGPQRRRRAPAPAAQQ
jgi:hypothetical protein